MEEVKLRPPRRPAVTPRPPRVLPATPRAGQVDRAPNGTIIPDPVRFPYGVVATARYIQSLGLHFGLYTAQREFTCQLRPGSWRFEDTDIDTYCDWGIDYVKTDACGGRGNAADNYTWIRFHAGIERCVARGGRPMVLSVESCNDPTGCGVWLPLLANTWRTTGDIQATFASVLSNLDANNNMAAIARPGAFNDADSAFFFPAPSAPPSITAPPPPSRRLTSPASPPPRPVAPPTRRQCCKWATRGSRPPRPRRTLRRGR